MDSPRHQVIRLAGLLEEGAVSLPFFCGFFSGVFMMGIFVIVSLLGAFWIIFHD